MANTGISTGVASLVVPEGQGVAVASSGRRFPPIINILQSDKQYVAFEPKVASSLTQGDYGKLFIRKPKGTNVKEDLVDSISGVLLGIQEGHELYSTIEGEEKIVGSGPSILQKTEKEALLDKGIVARNMIKVVLAPYSLEETLKRQAAGENPFVLLIIKGTGWSHWFDVPATMDAIVQNTEGLKGKSLSEITPSAFTFEVVAQKEVGARGAYYVPVSNVSATPIDVATGFMPLVAEVAKVKLFADVAQEVEASKAEEKVAEKKVADPLPWESNADMIESLL